MRGASGNNFIKVSVLAASKESTYEWRITFQVKTGLTEQVKTIETLYPNAWLLHELNSLLNTINPTHMHLTSRDFDEEYSYDDYIKGKMAVYNTLVKNNVPTKRRRLESVEHDEESHEHDEESHEHDEENDDTAVNFSLNQFWISPITRFCSLLI